MANSSLSDLQKKIDDAKKLVKIGGRYSHFKNPDHTYKVLDIVIYEATEEPLVIYKPEYGDTDFSMARAVSVWCEIVQKDGKEIRRFTPLDVI